MNRSFARLSAGRIAALTLAFFWTGAREVAAQDRRGCQPTLRYLADTIPATGFSQLDTLRQQLLGTDIRDVLAKMAAQHMSIDQAISLANQQADADAANLPSIETSIRGAAWADKADALMLGLKNRDYRNASFQEDVVGAAERAYVADDWGQLANRETAKQLRCYAANPLLTQANGKSSSATDASESPTTSPFQARDHSQASPLSESALGPSLSDTQKFIESHVDLGQALTYFGDSAGDEAGKFKGTIGWSSFHFDGCSLISKYRSMLVRYDGNSDRVLGTQRKAGEEGRTELGKLSPTSIQVRQQSLDMTDQYRQDGMNVSVTTTPNVYIVGVRVTSTEQAITPKNPSTSIPNIEYVNNHPELYTITERRRTTTDPLFATEDASLATRIAKAFNHAIELCGGKAEPF